MIKIRKDQDEKIVTLGMFEDLYEGMGYTIVGGKSSNKPAEQSIPTKPIKDEEAPVAESPKVENRPFKKEK